MIRQSYWGLFPFSWSYSSCRTTMLILSQPTFNPQGFLLSPTKHYVRPTLAMSEYVVILMAEISVTSGSHRPGTGTQVGIQNDRRTLAAGNYDLTMFTDLW